VKLTRRENIVGWTMLLGYSVNCMALGWAVMAVIQEDGGTLAGVSIGFTVGAVAGACIGQVLR